MIEKILIWLKWIAVLLPFVLLCLRSRKVNLKKPVRCRQFYMPFVAVLYMLVLLPLLDKVNSFLTGVLHSIPGWIRIPGEFSWMPETVSRVFLSAADWVKDFLDSLNLTFWIFLLANSFLILVYLIVKRIIINAVSAAMNNRTALLEKAVSRFYEYFAERDAWCLRDGYFQMRLFFQIAYYATVVISVILTLLSCRFYELGLLEKVFYPVFGVLIVGELYFFLDGATRREYTVDILGEDEDAYRMANYSLLRKFLRTLFGDKLLSEGTALSSPLARQESVTDTIRALEQEQDPKITAYAEYLAALNQPGAELDPACIRSAIDLLNGKSVLFNNPFYRDLVPYVFYPVNRTLLGHGKVLVILGRHAAEENITTWIEDGIGAVTKLPFMWNIGILSENRQELDIGIVTRSHVLSASIHRANADFLARVEFVIILEPSKLLSTAQIGLNLLIKSCLSEENKKLTFCLCDKNCDGLVDAMSHALMTDITEVSATEKHRGTSSYMLWETGGELTQHRVFPNISRYLGMGTELAFAALKNQISRAVWFGGESFPVADIRWIDRQYYYDLMKYAGLPTSQEAMDGSFSASADFWSAPVGKNNYFIVEDESFNMFEVLREFETRSREQGFINVLAPEYLLKDYMADNAAIFSADPKAIPYIAADYVRTARNTALRLALLMSTHFVSEEEATRELSVIGIEAYDLGKQLWYELYKCYAEAKEIALLPETYREAVTAAAEKTVLPEEGAERIGAEIIRTKQHYNIEQGKIETVYFIDSPVFVSACISRLRSAEYMMEDEKGERDFLGAELRDHVYQKLLPGQFFTFAGKYYEMLSLTAEGQVLVRRAADHIARRLSYRPIREYRISATRPSETIGSIRDICGMKIVREYADFTVRTAGYYQMEQYHDFRTARKVLLEGEHSRVPERRYHNKEILRIVLPEAEEDGKEMLSDRVRYTVCLLFHEVFRTLFAENQCYLAVLTDKTGLPEDGPDPLTYSVCGEDGFTLAGNSIYIVEDSQLDLGLTVAVERNLDRIFAIVQDYLDWHREVLEESLAEPEPPLPEPPEEEEEETKKGGIRGALSRLAAKIRGFFTGKRRAKDGEEKESDRERRRKAKKEEKERRKQEKREKKEREKAEKAMAEAEDDGTVEESTERDPGEEARHGEEPEPKEDQSDGMTGENAGESEKTENPEADTEPQDSGDGTKDGEEPKDENLTEAPERNSPPPQSEPEEDGDSEGSEKPEEDGDAQPEEKEKNEKPAFPFGRREYYERYYLLFGGESEPERLDVEDTYRYLTALGFGRNDLKQTRANKDIAKQVEETYVPNRANARYCDFCGEEILGAEYDVLADGRERCTNCGRTAITSEKEFRFLFEDVRRNLESFFGISLFAGIKVQMVNAQKLHRNLKKSFTPTPGPDGRILGVAVKDRNGYTLMVENGSPRLQAMLTVAHELTHIWQYQNWDARGIRRQYGDLRLQVYEGMAKWVEVQFAYLINETAVAKREELITENREDEYGIGFIRYRGNYPLCEGSGPLKATPFMNRTLPLDPHYCGNPDGIPRPRRAAEQPEEEGSSYIRRRKKEDGGKEPQGGVKSRNPLAVKRYCRELLRDSEKAVYDRFLEGLLDFRESIGEFGTDIRMERFEDIRDFVMADHPEILWCNGAYYTENTPGGTVLAVRPIYTCTKEEAEQRVRDVEEAVAPFLGSIGPELSDYQVALRVYENIIRLIDYDSIALDKQKKKDVLSRLSEPDDLRSIYGVFVNKKAVCAGYAKATQYLLNTIGLDCAYITSSTHAWNLIRLEGNFYHLDTTWGDASNTDKKQSGSDRINYDYFCMTTEEVNRLKDHRAEAKYDVPVCTATECGYYRRSGLYFSSCSREQLAAAILHNIDREHLCLTTVYESRAVCEKMRKLLTGTELLREAVRAYNAQSSFRLSENVTVYEVRGQNKLLLDFREK